MKRSVIPTVVLGGLLVLGLTLSGCISTRAVTLAESQYPPVSPVQVKVFMTEQEIHQPFERLAIVTATAGYQWDQTALIDAMKEKAAKLGANGIILNQYREATTGEKVANALLLAPANNEYQSVAIRLK